MALLEKSFKEISPVDVGIIYEGERLRWKETHVELGGIRSDKKFEIVKARNMDEIEDEKTIVVGKDIDELEPENNYSFGILIEVAGAQVEEELEGVIERRIHDFTNWINGVMHLNQRYDVIVRIGKKTFKEGFTKFKYWGDVLCKLFKEELPIIEKMQVTFITDPDKVEEMYAKALEIYEARDARARGLRDEEVGEFYACTLCQSFAPTHVCVITPSRISLCGAISWFDARAAARIDPEGANFPIEKGELLDDVVGEYAGVNETIKKRSMGETERVYLHSIFDYPHTSCGCFEAIAFYIPEVDGIGIVNRDFKGKTPNGLTFAELSSQVGGGAQVNGFVGMAIEYIRSYKFLEKEGGLNRVVWMPKFVKDRVMDALDGMAEKIATEEDAETLEDLENFLKNANHPVVERWVEEEIPAEAAEAEAGGMVAPSSSSSPIIEAGTITLPGGALLPGIGGGVKIVLKSAKIYAEKMIIRKMEKGK